MLYLKAQFTPKIVINYSPSCYSKPVRYFWLNLGAWDLRPCIDNNTTDTFKTQKSSKDIIKYSMWHQWFNLNVMKQQEYFLCANWAPVFLWIPLTFIGWAKTFKMFIFGWTVFLRKLNRLFLAQCITNLNYSHDVKATACILIFF